MGVPSAAAMSTVIAFRVATYFLPPVWGAIAMRWLRRHSYLCMDLLMDDQFGRTRLSS